MTSRAAAGALITVVAALACPAWAGAASTRAEYVAQADPICQAGHVKAKHEARQFKRQIHRLVRKGLDPDQPTKPSLRALVRFYDRLARVARSVNADLAAIPPPPGDETTVSEWLTEREKIIVFFQRAGHAFARNQKPHQFRRLMGRSEDARLRSWSLVDGWGFQHCF